MSGMLERLRGGRGAMDEVQRRLDTQAERFDHQRKRLDTQAERIANQGKRLDKVTKQNDRLKDQVGRQSRQIERLKAAIADIEGRLRPVERGDNLRTVDHGRMAQQVSVLEERVGRVEQMAREGTLEADDASLAEARNIVDAVRHEHDQVKVRFQIISSYEERLRRLEIAVVEMYDGDIRNPI